MAITLHERNVRSTIRNVANEVSIIGRGNYHLRSFRHELAEDAGCICGVRHALDKEGFDGWIGTFDGLNRQIMSVAPSAVSDGAGVPKANQKILFPNGRKTT
ncbi:hypothetical protein AA0229_0453 [Gluconobacter cerinus NRIC 0229]|nr:hypothetical protein AA0229_0453 [Gluconobacter cerinus NRIC 0229]